eukprot:scpid57662/ scgid10986/ 
MKSSPLAALSNPLGFFLFVSLGLNIVLLRPWEQRAVTPSKNLSIRASKQSTRRNFDAQDETRVDSRVPQDVIQPAQLSAAGAEIKQSSNYQAMAGTGESTGLSSRVSADAPGSLSPPTLTTTQSPSKLQVLLDSTTRAALRTQESSLAKSIPSPLVIRQNGSSFLAPCKPPTASGDMHAEKERIHAQGMKERKLYWQYLNGELSRASPLPWTASDPVMAPAYIHWSVEPTWSCNIMQRLGTLGDGGKEMCDAKRLLAHDRPLVYSFGSKLECDFEKQLKGDFPAADIHVFDPTPGVVEGFSRSQCAALVSFHPTGLGGYTKSLFLDGINHFPGRNVKLEDLLSIQASLGHQNRVIDVLKIDIEGSEFDAFKHLAANAQNWPGAKLIMLEVHLFGNKLGENWRNTLQVFQKLFSDFDAMGFRVYYKEINPYDGKRCVEYALINDKYLR